MHSGRIVIANRSAGGLKGVLVPFSKAIRSIFNQWGHAEKGQCGKGGWRCRAKRTPAEQCFGEKRTFFHRNVSWKTKAVEKLTCP